MNPFESRPDHIDIVDSPDRRVLLECQECGTMSFEGKYWPTLKLLSWKCPKGHLNKQGIDLDE